jgi:hypothetical protein
VPQNAAPNQYASAPNSWPATAVIKIRYRAILEFFGVRRHTEIFRYCGGVLINRRTILASASCLSDRLSQRWWNQTTEVDIEFNELQRHHASIYYVYVGSYFYPGYGTLSNDSDHLIVDDIIFVSLFFSFYFFYFFF